MNVLSCIGVGLVGAVVFVLIVIRLKRDSDRRARGTAFAVAVLLLCCCALLIFGSVAGLFFIGKSSSAFAAQAPNAAPTEPSKVVFQNGTVDVSAEEITIALVPGETALLERLPHLKKAELSGSADPAEIFAFSKTHPDISVACAITLFGSERPYDLAALTVDGGAQLPEILEAAEQLPNLQQLDLCACELDNEALAAICAAYPELDVRCTVHVLGQAVDSKTDQLILRTADADAGEIEAALTEAVPLLRGLTYADVTQLPAALSAKSVRALQQRFPNVEFKCALSLFGQSVLTTDTSIDLYRVSVTNEGVPALREALSCLPSCTYADMAYTDIDNETMAALARDFPNIRFSWMVFFGEYRCRTDANMLKASWPRASFTSDAAEPIRYCTELVHLDIGHNLLTDLSFLSELTELRVLIAAISRGVTDITPLANLTKLEYLELFTNKITDISPLAGLKELRHLNLCNNKITDASPLYGLKGLERLWISGNPLSEEQKEMLREQLPNCDINFTTENPTAEGWKKHPRYDLLSEQFRYGSGTIYLRFDMPERH